MKITPTSCLVELDSITIDQAIEKMNFFEVDYILLKNSSGVISGIFTDLDLKKSIREIVDQGGLHLPVSQFMNRKFKTLPLGLIQTAPEFMRDHGLKHVPITHMETTKKVLEVVGIVTLSALYEQIVRLRGLPNLFPTSNNYKKRRLLGVASPDGSLWQLMEKVFSDSPQIDVRRYRFAELQNNASLQSVSEECDALILDIDDAPDRYWRPTAEFMSKNKGLEFLGIAMTEKSSDERLDILSALEQQGVVHLYKKPIDITKIVLSLEKFWAYSD